MNEEARDPENPQEFSKDPIENLRIENEILRIKVKTELGGEFEMDESLPPELENEFLKNILAFEHRYAKMKMVKLADLLGNPELPFENELNDNAVAIKFKELEDLLAEKNIVVEFIRERDDRFKYKFITEELLEHETDDMDIEGMTKYFNYEEFHPDHEEDIKEYTLKFLGDWFQRKTDAAKWYLEEQFIFPDGTSVGKDEMIARFKKVFAAYTAFENSGYYMDNVQFELHDNNDERNQGMGFAEGMVKYTAVLESGEKQDFEGPFKVYFSRTYGRWGICFFYLTGFNI